MRIKEWKQMQVKLVGGAVRDALLGREAKDLDWLVIDKTEEEMEAMGFIRVGKSSTCPVFIHPDDPNGEEYALPRKEISTGKGYNDFLYETTGVTIWEDLRRRDFTINAMCADAFEAHDVCGKNVIDFFGGIEDLNNKIIKHVDAETFIEDPLRVIRACRIACKLGFTIHYKTKILCRKMCHDGMLRNLSPDRIYQELCKVWDECEKPSMFFAHLADVDALYYLFPFIHMMLDIPQPPEHHKEGSVLTHTMMCLDYAAKTFPKNKVLMFSVLYHDIGKTLTLPSDWPSHHGHDGEAAVKLITGLAKASKFDTFTTTCCKLVVKYHMKFHRIDESRPFTIVKMLREMKVKHTFEFFDIFLASGVCDQMGRIPSVANMTSTKWIWIAEQFSKHRHEMRDDREFSPIAKMNMIDQSEVNCVKRAIRDFEENNPDE
jgi:tRNA nucleotidyltransferase (CCA-adding enzyme)